MDPAIKQAGELKQKLQADIAKLLNAYTDATGLKVNDLRLSDTIRGYAPVSEAYAVSVEVRL
jgi:hypothetical protein